MVPHCDVELPCIDGAGAVGVEEIEGLLDLFPLLRRQPLAAAPIPPVTGPGGVGRRLLPLPSEVARLHAKRKAELSSAYHSPME